MAKSSFRLNDRGKNTKQSLHEIERIAAMKRQAAHRAKQKLTQVNFMFNYLNIFFDIIIVVFNILITLVKIIFHILLTSDGSTLISISYLR